MALQAAERGEVRISRLNLVSGGEGSPVARPGPLVRGASGAGGYGGAPPRAARRSSTVLRRRRRCFGGSPAVARQALVGLACVEAYQHPQVAHHQAAGEDENGAKPISRHQPREMSLLAGSFIVELARSAAVRRA